MHVALIDPSEFTPPYDAALAGGLAAAGHRVTIIGQAGSSFGRDAALDHRGHFYRPLDTALGRRLPAAAARALKGVLHAIDLARLPGLLRDLEVDIIHLQWAPLPVLDQLFLDRLRAVAPVVLTVHDTLPYNGAEPRLMSAGLGRLIRRVDAVICHTDQGRRRLLQQGVEASRLAVVPHGLLGAKIDPAAAPLGERIRLLQFGKIKPYKGVDVLLEALAQLPAEVRAHLDVHIVGKPYVATEPLVRQVREQALGDCVRFTFDFVADAAMARHIAEADALVFPYRAIEASGVLMQAVAAGKPVVASRIGIFAELLEHGRHGLLVEPGKPCALRDALRVLTAAPERLAAMRSEMCALRDRLPGWPAIGHQTAKVYGVAGSRWGSVANCRPAVVQEPET